MKQHALYVLVGTGLAIGTLTLTAGLFALMYVASVYAPTFSAWAGTAAKWSVVSGVAVLCAYSIYKMGALWSGDPDA